jgi:hypothetical protein
MERKLNRASWDIALRELFVALRVLVTLVNMGLGLKVPAVVEGIPPGRGSSPMRRERHCDTSVKCVRRTDFPSRCARTHAPALLMVLGTERGTVREHDRAGGTLLEGCNTLLIVQNFRQKPRRVDVN